MGLLGWLTVFVAAAWIDSARVNPSTKDRVSAAPYAGNEDEYNAERRALRGGRGERVSGTLTLRLANGQIFQLVDKIEDGGEHRRYVYERYLSDAGLHVVNVEEYEGGGYLVVHGGVASEAWLRGRPPFRLTDAGSLASRANLRMPTLRTGSRSGESTTPAWCGSSLSAANTCGARENAAWVDASTVRFVRVQIDRQESKHERVPIRLFRRNSGWTLQQSAD